MALAQEWLLPQAKESLSSQPVEESVQKTDATFQPRLMKMKNPARGCWQLFLRLAEGQKLSKIIKKWSKMIRETLNKW